MSIKTNLKELVKKILTGRCDRRYDRIYSHALDTVGYTNRIHQWEAARWEAWQKELAGQPAGQPLPGLHICTYDWEKPIDLQEVLSGCGEQEEWIVFLDSRCRLAEHSREYLAGWALLHRESLLIYGDEDVRRGDSKKGREDGIRRFSPWLKPDWSPDLLREMFYVGGLFAVRKDLLERTEGTAVNLQTHDLFLALAELAGGYERREPGTGGKAVREEKIAHLPMVLCHHEEEADYQSYLSSRRPLAEHETEAAISIVIPSKDHPEVLERNLLSLERTMQSGLYLQPMEIIIVDNGSSQENRRKIEAMIQRFPWEIRYLYEPMQFNFSQMCNIGAARAIGDLLLFLNDDVEAIEPGWLEQMAAKAVLPYVGAVGAKLLYPGSDKIQHAGIVNLDMGPVHKLQFCQDSQAYYFDRNRCSVNVLAVTGACLMVRRQVFAAAGGFPEELPVAFNDVDLCFTLWEQGYYNVAMNGLGLYHHESLSRGDDESRHKLARQERERAKLYCRHRALEGQDPYYHPLLNGRNLDTEIRPAPEEELDKGPEPVTVEAAQGLGEARPFKNLFLRIESLSLETCRGYSFMLGDDNACYEKWMLWENEADGQLFRVKLSPRLRSDLVNNMPDQRHVGMCGFELCPVGLPRGEYRIGVLARNQVTGVNYVNWSNRILSVDE